ncbi:FkbM family methyltransferase [Chryseobacterium sp. A301]
MSLYSQLAETLSYIAPSIYKERFFKKLKHLDASNRLESKVEPELYWLKSKVQKQDVFLDIGSNVGAYLYTLEKTLKSDNLYGFEPNRFLYKRLKRLFPTLPIFPLALSDQNQMAEFKVPVIRGSKVKSRGTLQTHLKEEGEEAGVYQRVKVMRLDDWAPMEHFERLDFIKIDVEGSEEKTLKGAQKTIKRFKPTLLVEIEQRHHESPIWPLILEVCSWQYKPFYVDPSSLELIPLEKGFYESQGKEGPNSRTPYINNIIFVPEK